VGRGSDPSSMPLPRPSVALKAAEVCNEHAWAFWLEVERAVKELLTENRAVGRDAALTER
jgi:hypothetical protein